jgi:hypothetical protein
MRPHDLAEMHKQPLDAVMLSLRAMMADEESVAEILSEALEPPEEVRPCLSMACGRDPLVPRPYARLAPL